MWTPARVEQLTQLWKDGRSASECARALGECSRNAVIGKVHRLGLAGRDAPSRPARPVRASVDRVRMSRNPAPSPRVFAPPVQEAAGLATIQTLSQGGCHWPIGDPNSPDFTFCGRHRRRGAYCEDHALRAYRPASSKDVMRLARFA
ncbi:MAG TPA: GcrA family cell cycle regulator [Caulobacteraceae bacterium]|jgi:GcrA cell cycle regulator